MFQESCVQPEFIILYLEGGAEFQQKISKILHCISLEGDPGLSPILHYFFLTVSPLILHYLPSLVSNCLNLLFGTQGQSRRLNPYFPTNKKWGTQKGFVPGRTPQGSGRFQECCRIFF